jgi:Fur family ferric uptake transcriptional regulator
LTLAPQTPPLSFESIEDAIRAVRDRGMRLSTARRLVLEAFFAAAGPVSAVHLAHTLSIDESSVYRNLEVLERHGLIRHVHLGHGPGLYVLLGGHETEYIYCERCAKVTAVAPEELDPLRETIKEQFGYQARFAHFAIVGLCEQCAAHPEPPLRPGEGATIVAEPHAHHHDLGSPHNRGARSGHEHLHSHGDHAHSHPHNHGRQVTTTDAPTGPRPARTQAGQPDV